MSDEQLLAHLAWLNSDEVARYRSFIRPERQRQFLIGRSLLRYKLGKLLGVRPEAISFSERPGYAPLLNWMGAAPEFSLSHSGPWIACAISTQTALGLDIEVMNSERDLLALSEQALDADDVTLIKGLQGKARVMAFYECWSKKEARYKLASMCGSESEDNCIKLSHPEISIVLCSALPLAETPMLASFEWPSIP